MFASYYHTKLCLASFSISSKPAATAELSWLCWRWIHLMLNNNYFYGNHCSIKKDFLMQSYWIDETADGCSAIRIIIKTETVTAQRMFHFVSEKRRYTGFTLIKVFTQRVNQLTAHQCISKFNQSLTSYLKKQHQGLEGDFSHRIRVFFLYHFTSSFRSFFSSSLSSWSLWPIPPLFFTGSLSGPRTVDVISKK